MSPPAASTPAVANRTRRSRDFYLSSAAGTGRAGYLAFAKSLARIPIFIPSRPKPTRLSSCVFDAYGYPYFVHVTGLLRWTSIRAYKSIPATCAECLSAPVAQCQQQMPGQLL